MAMQSSHCLHTHDILMPGNHFVMVDKGWQHPRRQTSSLSSASSSSSSSLSTSARSATDATTTTTRAPAPAVDPALALAHSSRKYSPHSNLSDGPVQDVFNEMSSSAPAEATATARRQRKQQKPPSTAGRKLQFINASDPNHNRDPSVRMLVRSHVMKGVKREEKLAKSAKSAKAAAEQSDKQASQHRPQHDTLVVTREDSPPPLGNPCQGSTMSLYGATPIASRPESHKLLNYYRQVIGSAVYPFPEKLSYNPLESSWIPCALSDEIFFKTLMFSSASHLAFSTGGAKVANLPTVILQSVFSQLGHRLNGNLNLSDATIGAVTCLAMVENMRGNFSNYSLHMVGLKNILAQRDMDDVEPQMRLKVYRTEVEGAVNFLARPHLAKYTRKHPPLEAVLPHEYSGHLNTDDLRRRLALMGLSDQLLDCFCTTARFARSLDYVLRNPNASIPPTSYDEDFICVQMLYIAVCIDDESGINRAARIGGMLFVKSAFRSIGAAPPSSKLLVKNLKDSLLVLRPEARTAPLVLWLVFVGCVSSFGLPEHSWFLERLTAITMNVPGYQSWEHCVLVISNILWVDSIHRNPCRSVWEAVWGRQAALLLS